MLCNPVSFYPDKIDPLLFFQDISLENVEIMNTYERLIKKSRYSEASEYIKSQKGIFGYFADFLNAIENRIYNLQEHLLTIEPKQPFVYSDTEPVLMTANGTYYLLADYSHDQLSKSTHEELAAHSVNSTVSNHDIIWI